MEIAFVNLFFFPQYSHGQQSPAVTKSGAFYYTMWFSFFITVLILTILLSINLALAGDTSQKIKEEVVVSYEDSPFGFLNSYINNSFTKPIYAAYGGFSAIQSFYRDLNVYWNRMGALSTKPSIHESYDWAELDEYVNTANKNNIHSLITIAPGEERYLPANGVPYVRLVRELIRRYGSMVKYYQIHNEVNGGVFWKDTPQNYAQLVRVTSNIIREICPDCKIVLGSSTNVGEKGKFISIDPYFGPLFEELNKDGKKYFDVFDYHFFAPQGYTPETYYQALDKEIDLLNNLLNKYGYNHTKIWITETLIPTTYGMSDKFIQTWLPKEYQKISERQQALALIKTHILALSKGVKKIFCSSLTEGPWPEHDPLYDNVGLIRHPSISGSTEKKLSYYTYKRMVEMLDGSDWNKIQTIQKKDGVYIYKFIKRGKPIWAAWNDNKEAKSHTISDIISAQIKITEAVPKYQLGKEVKDYSMVFDTETKTADKNKITITLGETPIFFEEK